MFAVASSHQSSWSAQPTPRSSIAGGDRNGLNLTTQPAATATEYPEESSSGNGFLYAATHSEKNAILVGDSRAPSIATDLRIEEVEMWRTFALLCLPWPLLLLFALYKQLLKRYETRNLISRLRSAEGL